MPEGSRRSEPKHGLRNTLIGLAVTTVIGGGLIGLTRVSSAVDSNKRTFQSQVNDCPDSIGFTQVGKEIRVGNEVLKVTSVVVPQGSNFEFAICILNDTRYVLADLQGRGVEIFWRGNTFIEKSTGEILFDVIDGNKPKLSEKYRLDTLKNYLVQKGFYILPANEPRKITPNELEGRDRAIAVALLVIAGGLLVGIPVIGTSMNMSTELKRLRNTVVANTEAAATISELREQARQARELANNERKARQVIEEHNKNLRKANELNKRGGRSSRRF